MIRIRQRVDGRSVVAENGSGPLTRGGFHEIIEGWGGVDNLTSALRVDRTTVCRWLGGSRRIRPAMARLIRAVTEDRS